MQSIYDDDDYFALTGGPCCCCVTMPKADAPPAYEEAISTAKYEDYQHPPQYSDPGYGVGPAPPPAPPPAYSPGPAMYTEQPGYSSYPPQAGFPPAGMPPYIIPTLSAGISPHGQGEEWHTRGTQAMAHTSTILDTR